jgi:ribosomal protein S18 acetylase RimI-like enzyme
MPATDPPPSSPSTYAVRSATARDLPAVSRLAAELVRYHHALDARRFLLVEPLEQGYQRFLSAEIKNPNVVLLVAEESRGKSVVGYAYGRLEPRDWNMLLDSYGALHDILVAKSARRSGVGELLVRETCARLEALGAPRVLLSTAVQNEAAQALFERVGFRRTMIEMTRERGG